MSTWACGNSSARMSERYPLPQHRSTKWSTRRPRSTCDSSTSITAYASISSLRNDLLARLRSASHEGSASSLGR